MESKFYVYRQNNSGGSFEVDDNLTHFVIVEADNIQHAIEKGEQLGIYFDGCVNGFDCACCGDRWYEPDLIENEPDIMLYAQKQANSSRWCTPELILHMKDGFVHKFYTQDV